MRRNFPIAMMLAAGAAMALGGCVRRESAAASYFPLRTGMTWTFRFTASTGASGELTTANLAPRKIFGFQTVPQQNLGGDQPYTEFYADDGAGIRHVAIDESEGLQSRLNDHSYVIKQPVRTGTSWHEIDRTFDGTIYNATTRIEALADTVKVPAGTYRNCVRVHSTGTASTLKGTARLPRYSDVRAVAAGEDVVVEDYYWLAAGVGPVKATHEETRGEGSMTRTISYKLELESLKR